MIEMYINQTLSLYPLQVDVSSQFDECKRHYLSSSNQMDNNDGLLKLHVHAVQQL